MTKSKSDPKDYVFFIGEEQFEDTPLVCIVRKAFWEKRKCMEDRHISSRIESWLPEDFSEEMESAFLYEGTPDDARGRLLALGLTEVKFGK